MNDEKILRTLKKINNETVNINTSYKNSSGLSLHEQTTRTLPPNDPLTPNLADANLKNKPTDNTNKKVAIDTRYKEMYYYVSKPVEKETQETRNQNIFWNYLMHESMQNTISQMNKVS